MLQIKSHPYKWQHVPGALCNLFYEMFGTCFTAQAAKSLSLAHVSRPISVWILKCSFYVSFVEHSENVFYGKALNGNFIKSPCLKWRNTSAICFYNMVLDHLRWASLASYTETTGWPISLSLIDLAAGGERYREREREQKRLK